MQSWIKLTAQASGGGSYHVNMEHVSHIFREDNVTKVCIAGADHVALSVTEKPHEIFELLDKANANRT
jgi:hypothetical protein